MRNLPGFYVALGVMAASLCLCAFAGTSRPALRVPSPRPDHHELIIHSPQYLPPGTFVQSDIVYRSVDGVDLHVDVLVPRGVTSGAPMVVWLHGGGFQRGGRWPLGRGTVDLLESGFVVATVEYRLAPRWRWPAPLEDAREAIRFLRHNAAHWSADPMRIGVWGHSVGGTLAELLALEGLGDKCRNGIILPQDAVQAAIALSGRTDFLNPKMSTQARRSIEQAFRPEDGARALRDASPLFHVGGEPIAPLLIIHGRLDQVAPFDDAVRLNDRLVSPGDSVEFVAYDDVGHETDVARVDVSERIVEFFSRTLGR